MGLLNKLLGGPARRETAASRPLESSQFQESQVAPAGNAQRRDLVQVVLRDTMRKHGIPSDWMDCRVLPVVRRNKSTGVHVQLVVKQGHDDLLAYLYAFQESFQLELEQFDPRWSDWLLSLAWQFMGKGTVGAKMPEPAMWAAAAAAPAAAAGATAVAPLAAAPAATAAPPTEAELEEDSVEEDLRALFAIRDEALRGDGSGDEPPDFQPTQPGFVDSNQR